MPPLLCDIYTMAQPLGSKVTGRVLYPNACMACRKLWWPRRPILWPVGQACCITQHLFSLPVEKVGQVRGLQVRNCVY